MHHFIDKLWYRHHPLRWLLLPCALVYQAITIMRRHYLQRYRQKHVSVPVSIVGNLTVGGVGKTPLVIALACQFKAQGLRVGIVSRGFGAQVCMFPHEVKFDENASLVGDEPLLLAKKTGCPVVVAPKRNDAVQYLIETHQSQIIISDDGLQHYAMGRAIEIVVIDGTRGLGNGLCLPAGPLREGPSRLSQADFIVVNGGDWPNAYRMDLEPGHLTQLSTGDSMQLSDLTIPFAAVAGIGNPERFFSQLKAMGLVFKAYSFADHHVFQPKDLSVSEKMVVMTEKDAVKCESFATEAMYFLPVEAHLPDKFWDALLMHQQLQGLK